MQYSLSQAVFDIKDVPADLSDCFESAACGECHVCHMVEVFREVRRVMRHDATAWINYGDSFKYKQLVGMPWRIAFALQKDGWWLRSEIIWGKLNPMPESVTDRPTKAHEQVFLLSKNPTYFYDADAVREDRLTDRNLYVGARYKGREGGHGTSGSLARYEATGEHADMTEGRNLRSVWTIPTAPFPEAHFATFPPALVEPCIKAGTSERGCCAECGAPWERVVEAKGGTIGTGDWGKGFAYESGRSKQRGQDLSDYERKTTGWRPTCAHGGEPVPCTVLDPFFGAGTTGLVADRLGRNCIGVELNPKYAAMAERRLRADCPMFTEVTVQKGTP